MSTLQFSHKPSPKARIRIYQLHQTGDRTVSKGSTLSVQDAVLIHRGNSDVYRATMRRSIDNTPFDVVVKIKYEDFAQIRREARIYKRLTKCQGETIPRCYGLFEGLFAGRKAACLVLEDCGTQLEEEIDATSWTFKFHVMDCVIHIHENGVEHNDLEERNIVVRPDGRPRIIDFDHASLHECGAKMDITIHDWEPTPGELGCGEMHDVARMMLLWQPRTIRYLGHDIDVYWAKTPELLVTQAPKGTLPRHAEAHARKAVEEYQKWLQWKKDLPWK